MQETFQCSQCDCELTESERNLMNDETLCDDCYCDETVSCHRCDTRIWNENNAGNDCIPLCQQCYDYHYTNCERCGCLTANDDAYYAEDDDDNETPYCYDCHERHERHTYLHSYSYKPEPIFMGEGSRYFGVELEIDDAGKCERNAKRLCETANSDNDNIYIKTDSSLDDGLELVTHPMSLDYHMREMPWKALLVRALELDYKSHIAETCGLHVHVNRKSFSEDYIKQEECIGRVLYFIERFWEEMLRFSRRTESQLKRWASRYGYKERPADILDAAKKGYGGRYTCVNLTNYSTIEFRIFRGTLKYNTLIATLQLVNEICNVAFSMSDDELSRLGWCDFMERLTPEQYPELITYLKERRLYINEPVLCEAEV